MWSVGTTPCLPPARPAERPPWPNGWWPAKPTSPWPPRPTWPLASPASAASTSGRPSAPGVRRGGASAAAADAGAGPGRARGRRPAAVALRGSAASAERSRHPGRRRRCLARSRAGAADRHRRLRAARAGVAGSGRGGGAAGTADRAAYRRRRPARRRRRRGAPQPVGGPRAGRPRGAAGGASAGRYRGRWPPGPAGERGRAGSAGRPGGSGRRGEPAARPPSRGGSPGNARRAAGGDLAGRGSHGTPGSRRLRRAHRPGGVRAARALFGLGLLAAIVLGFGGLRPGLAAAAPADRTPRGPVVVVGVPGLRWDQVSPDATPALAALVARGAVGSLSIRAGSGITCAADGWLTLGAGNRATGPSHPGAGCPPDLPTGPVVAQAGGGALAAADPRGRIDRYVDHLPPDAPNLADALGQCALTVVALPPAQSAVPDAEIAAVDAARPTGSLLVVVGLAESGSQPRLHVAAAVGPGMGAGYLTSASTRRPPYVQLVDGAPTVLAQLGLPAPAGAIGQPWRSVEGRPAGTPATVAALVDTDRAAQAQRRVVGPFFFGLELAQGAS